MKVLIDTDIILDYLLKRSEFAEVAREIWLANEAGQFEGFICAITPVNVFYIARKLRGAEFSRRIVHELLLNWKICDVNQQILENALQSPVADFEDAVQVESARFQQLDAVVTRNINDYSRAALPVMSPSDFLLRLTGSQ
jgi:predicted nucleic acid-binding protein